MLWVLVVSFFVSLKIDYFLFSEDVVLLWVRKNLVEFFSDYEIFYIGIIYLLICLL